MMDRRRFLKAANLLLVAPAGLAACQESTQVRQQQAAAAMMYAMAADANGFSTGTSTDDNVVYVFFDAFCGHCSTLWNNMKKFSGQLRVVWIPVALLKRESVQYGGAILGAADPVMAMDQHAEAMISRKNSQNTPVITERITYEMQRNTTILLDMSIDAVPAIFYKNPNKQQLELWLGVMSEQTIEQLMLA
jgi:thiol:disulfide interchange protein DsbG